MIKSYKKTQKYITTTIEKFITFPNQTKIQLTGIIKKIWTTKRNKHTAIAIQENNQEIIALKLKNQSPIKIKICEKIQCQIKGTKIANDFIIIDQIKEWE